MKDIILKNKTTIQQQNYILERGDYVTLNN